VLKHIPPGGSIINATSIQAFEPSSNLASYAATKAAIANFTLSLASEAINQGVRVNGMAPGPIWTPLITRTCCSLIAASVVTENAPIKAQGV
tara:strand:- start:33 stop:308 length:276 start_codon:yes stop_codon:yes gene_type:complete